MNLYFIVRKRIHDGIEFPNSFACASELIANDKYNGFDYISFYGEYDISKYLLQKLTKNDEVLYANSSIFAEELKYHPRCTFLHTNSYKEMSEKFFQWLNELLSLYNVDMIQFITDSCSMDIKYFMMNFLKAEDVISFTEKYIVQSQINLNFYIANFLQVPLEESATISRADLFLQLTGKYVDRVQNTALCDAFLTMELYKNLQKGSDICSYIEKRLFGLQK